ncbi:MAG TPA: permease prefix domain 1-containing protein, partial [Verrucomicrobiae bacterium]|nr:permease prefix domain 1-containing protein [Verrucomicrobiae bacterium]
WRRSMRAKISADQIAELEDHLRERVAELMRGQVPVADAFHKAALELGSQTDLAAEFQRGNTSWLPLKLAMAVGAILIVVGVVLWIRISSRPLGLVLGPHVFLITLGYGGALLIGCLGISYAAQRSIRDFTPTRAQSIARNTATLARLATVLTAIGFVFGMVWAHFAWDRAFSGDAKEIGALAVLASQICLIAAQRTNALSARAVMTIAIAVGVVCACAWFGANTWMMNKSMHSWPLWIIVIPHLIALFAALLPSGWLAAERDAKSGT